MNREEIAGLFEQDAARVKYFAEQGLLNLPGADEDVEEYQKRLGDRLCLLQLLLTAGLSLKELQLYVKLLEQGSSTGQERITILQHVRFNLLDKLHLQQKALDKLDFLIYKLKKEGKHG